MEEGEEKEGSPANYHHENEETDSKRSGTTGEQASTMQSGEENFDFDFFESRKKSKENAVQVSREAHHSSAKTKNIIIARLKTSEIKQKKNEEDDEEAGSGGDDDDEIVHARKKKRKGPIHSDDPINRLEKEEEIER